MKFRLSLQMVVLALLGAAAGPDRFSLLWVPRALAEEAGTGDPEERAEDPGDEGLYLPTDRQRQRQLDRAKRLLDDRRWSDAATLLDEILAADNDSFHRQTPAKEDRAGRPSPQRVPSGVGRDARDRGTERGTDQGTWKSIKATASDLIAALGDEGRIAYELQFRARAERALDEAIQKSQPSQVVAVASRWFHTPAGGRAALLLAEQALESDQPLAAGAWLDRLLASRQAQDFEPTLSVMRAVAWLRAGEETRAIATLDRARGGRRASLRIAGRDATVAYPTGTAADWLGKLVGKPPADGSRTEAEWLVQGGSPSRNGFREGFRPLLSPRYRVPIARHPEEARQLERYRRSMAEQDIPLLPAGQPLAVGGRLLAHSALGLLAIDFESGKRMWMQAGPYGDADDLPATDDPANAGGDRMQTFENAFDDATAGTLSSDGRLVFAVESPKQRGLGGEVAAGFRPAASLAPGNTLSAYDVRNGGRLVWRLPDRRPPATKPAAKTADDDDASGGGGAPWFAGPPLPVGDQLFLIVEERGGVRLDVLEASSGKTLWSQPLAEVDDARSIDKPGGRQRRLAGLSPSLSEGVLVCPTGAGAVVGVDLAARALTWAYCYPLSTSGEDMVVGPNVVGAGGMIIRRGVNGMVMIQSGGSKLPPKRRWLDGPPVIADGRVILTPRESDDMHCLDLRTGEPQWTSKRNDRLYVAGIVDGSAIVVGRHAVEALSVSQKGRPSWTEPVSLGEATPSGRGCVAKGRLFLPLDAPEVVEIDLTRAAIVGRSLARTVGGGHDTAAATERNAGSQPGSFAAGTSAMGTLPGNLIFYRGEVISQGIGAIDVFHQQESLEKAVETALSQKPDDGWALYWKGQLMLDRGRIADGVAAVQAAHAAEPRRIPASMVADTMHFAMERDFPHASGLWRQAAALAEHPAAKNAILRTAVDGFLKEGDAARAWEAFAQLAESGPNDDDLLVNDPIDPSLVCLESRWTRGRLHDIRRDAAAAVRHDVDATIERWFERATSADDPVRDVSRFLECFGPPFDPSAVGGDDVTLRARGFLCERLAAEGESEAAHAKRVRRDMILVSMLRSPDARERTFAASVLDWTRKERPGGTGLAPSSSDWPVGRVAAQRGSRRDDSQGRSDQGLNPVIQHHRGQRVVPIPCERSGAPAVPGLELPGLRLACDAQSANTIIATDALGRRLGDPLSFDEGTVRFGLIGGMQPPLFDASTAGRIVVARYGGNVAAFELAADGSSKNRRLWNTSGPHGVVMVQGLPGKARGGGLAHGIRRNAEVPLGMRIVEPAGDPQPTSTLHAGRATTAGVPIATNQSLEVRDLLSGAVLWARHRMPAGGELVGDEQFLTALPRNGKGATVLSMVDGRIVRRCDLPPRESRLCASGRLIVAIEADRTAGGSVGLVVIDPATGNRRPLGEFPADARAVRVEADAHHGDAVAVLDPRGRLTLLDIASASTLFSRTLDEMPAALEQFHVMPWEDRLLVVVGRQETPEEIKEIERLGGISSASQPWNSADTEPLLTGAVWAVDRESGESLWPLPVTLLRQGLQLAQPSDLPVLLFSRQVQAKPADRRPRLGLLCVDKRTGHDVFLDERERGAVDQPVFANCEIFGDPSQHRIFIDVGNERISLTFDGGPIAPRPPFQASSRPARGPDVWQAIESWMHRAIGSFPF